VVEVYQHTKLDRNRNEGSDKLVKSAEEQTTIETEEAKATSFADMIL